MEFKQYDTVKIIEIVNPEKPKKSGFYPGVPKIGDIAAIVEIYTKPSTGYELECLDQEGTTQWLMAFGPEEIVMELV